MGGQRLKQQDNNIYQLESKRQQKTKLSHKKKDKKQRKKLKKRSMVFLCIFLYIMGFFCYQGFKIYQLKQEEKAILKNIELLAEEKAKYEAELNSVNSEEYVENFARENLRMVKENEILYVPKKDKEDKVAKEDKETE